jgi:hypothetical protein
MIQTKSVFYYIESVSTDNFYLNFNEGGVELTAEVAAGDYTHETLKAAVADAMNELASVGTITVSFDRESRKFTIASDMTLNLLVATGASVGSDIYELLGFTGADRTGSLSYEGDPAGSEYLPQFPLQSYVDEQDLRKSVQTSVNKSARGDIEVVTFGTEKFYEFELKFITNVDQGKLSLVETNVSGVQDARDFLRFVTSKRELEFMADRFNRNVLTADILIESTSESKDGTGYRLRELYAQGLVDYYESGKLVFKKVEF